MPVDFRDVWHAASVFVILVLVTFNSESAKNVAKKLKRDSKGHFIKSTISVTGPGDVVINPEFEKPVVTLSINNPIRKILYWLDQIRRHQTTTVAFRLSIPLIVIPLIIASAFSVGRLNGVNLMTQIESSPVVLKPNPALPVSISRAGILKTAISDAGTVYLLTLSNGAINVLDIPSTINLARYANKQILVTGTYDKVSNVLKVTNIAEVTVFNNLAISPEASGSAK